VERTVEKRKYETKRHGKGKGDKGRPQFTVEPWPPKLCYATAGKVEI